MLLFLLLAFWESPAQEKELAALLNSKNYSAALLQATEIQTTDPENLLAIHVKGRAYFHLAAALGRTDYFDSSILYLRKSLLLDTDITWVSAWSYLYCGYNNYIQGNLSAAKLAIDSCIRLNKTQNVTGQAHEFLELTNLTDYFDTWALIKGKYVNYHFQDTTGIRHGEYIAAHERACDSIMAFFKPLMLKHIDYFVWDDRRDAEQKLGRPLGFSVNQFYISNVRKDQTVGHEMTHILSYWGWGTPPKETNVFINEGIAVCFDITNQKDRLGAAKRQVKNSGIVSVVELWQSQKDFPEEIEYSVGGAFIEFLKSRSTSEEFRLLTKLQSFDSARLIYGNRLELLIAEFNALLGL